MTPGQTRALDRYWNRYGIDYTTIRLDLDQIFDRNAPRVLEIGAGAGEVTLALAREHPENDYLAVEVHKPGAGSLIRQAVAENIRNIRVLCHDVVETLEYQLPENSLDEVYIFFPDPWPKKRHHKRRLISSGFISLLQSRLKIHARLFIATDWESMAEQALTICDSEHSLVNLAGQGNFSPRPDWRPLTRFEQRGLNLKHQVRDLAYARTFSK